MADFHDSLDRALARPTLAQGVRALAEDLRRETAEWIAERRGMPRYDGPWLAGRLEQLLAASASIDEARLTEVDRNARAYGWEIGRGHPLVERLESTPDNPFLSKDWRANLTADEGGA